MKKFLWASVTIIVLLLSACSGHRSDQQLIDDFHAHKQSFERLREMFVNDKGLMRVGAKFTEPENPQTIGITEARLGEYRSLFSELRLVNGIGIFNGDKGEKESIYFDAFVPGRSTAVKGYAYLNKRPDMNVKDLDQHFGSRFAYHHIEGNWYLYSEDPDG